MQRIKNFLSFVEIQTKLCSFIPLLVGLAYTLYRYGTESFSVKYTLIFLVAMFFFDMSVTAINNYIGARQGITKQHYSPVVGAVIIIAFILFAAALGVLLTLEYGLVMLLSGAVCFAVGIFYTFGPISISKTPYGEIFSGLVQGFFLTFFGTLINTPKGQFITFTFQPAADYLTDGHVIVDFALTDIVQLIIVTIPIMLTIANIMLANNLCDVENDVKVKRYTLPYHLGAKHSLNLFAAIYYLSFLVIAVAAILQIVSPLCLLVLALFPLVQRNIKRFRQQQVKPHTFVLAVNNFTYMIALYALTIFIGSFLK